MQRIRRDRLAVVIDHRLLPVATVRPGETFVVETEDARGGQTRSLVDDARALARDGTLRVIRQSRN